MFVKHLQGWALHHFPGQPSVTLDHSLSLRKLFLMSNVNVSCATSGHYCDKSIWLAVTNQAPIQRLILYKEKKKKGPNGSWTLKFRFGHNLKAPIYTTQACTCKITYLITEITGLVKSYLCHPHIKCCVIPVKVPESFINILTPV